MTNQEDYHDTVGHESLAEQSKLLIFILKYNFFFKYIEQQKRKIIAFFPDKQTGMCTIIC